MKKKDWFVLALTLINCVILVVMLSNSVLREIVTLSGPLGDTIGGVMGPALGFFSAYYVYHAFEEQKTANALLRSDIARQRIAGELTEIRNDLDKVTYFSNEKIHSGISAAIELKKAIDQSGGALWRSIGTPEFLVIDQELSFLIKVNELWAKVIVSPINIDDRLSLRRIFVQLLDYYRINYYSILSDIHWIISIASGNKDDYDYATSSNINYIINLIANSIEQLEALERHGLIEINETKSLSAEEFFAVEEIQINKVKRRNALWIKPLY